MGKAINMIYSSGEYIRLSNNEVKRYYGGENGIGYYRKAVLIDELLTNTDYYKDIIAQHFIFVDSVYEHLKKETLTLAYLKECKEEYEKKREVWLEKYGKITEADQRFLDYICIYRELKRKEIKEYYRFDLKLEVRGLIFTKYYFDSDIQMFYYLGEHGVDHSVLESVLGKRKRYVGSPEPLAEFYIFYTKDVDKIIATKSYYTIDSVFEKTLELDGKKEEFVLDMHSFDDNIYQLFNKHYLLEIEEVDDPINEEDSEPVKSPWYKRLFGFQ